MCERLHFCYVLGGVGPLKLTALIRKISDSGRRRRAGRGRQLSRRITGVGRTDEEV